MRVLIAGSRHATAWMVQQATTVTHRALDAGHSLICGDAKGIDQVVAEVVAAAAIIDLDGMPLIRLTVCGIQAAPRHGVVGGAIDYRNLNGLSYSIDQIRYGRKRASVVRKRLPTIGTYTERDRYMCHQADMGVFVWDGRSSGTRRGYRYMCRLGKPAYLIYEGVCDA